MKGCASCGCPSPGDHRRAPITEAGRITRTASGLVLDGWSFAGGPLLRIGGWSLEEMAQIATDLDRLNDFER